MKILVFTRLCEVGHGKTPRIRRWADRTASVKSKLVVLCSPAATDGSGSANLLPISIRDLKAPGTHTPNYNLNLKPFAATT